MSNETTEPRSPLKYRVLRQIGEGGFARVYEGRIWFPDRERPCAIKVIRDDRLNEYALASFLREASLGFDLSRGPSGHAGLVRVHDYHLNPDGLPFIVMERVDGPSVHDARDALRGKWELIARIARDVLDILRHVHAAGVIHRDIAAGNILLDRRGAVRLCDLGLARPETGPQSDCVRGTVPYASPELLRGEPVTRASDVYSLGAVLYELATGAPPYGEHVIRALANMKKPLPPLPDDTPAALSCLIPWLLALDPAQRPSIDQALEALAPLAITTDDELTAFVDRWLGKAKTGNSKNGQPSGDDAPSGSQMAFRRELAWQIYKLPSAAGDAMMRALDALEQLPAGRAGMNTEQAAAYALAKAGRPDIGESPFIPPDDPSSASSESGAPGMTERVPPPTTADLFIELPFPVSDSATSDGATESDSADRHQRTTARGRAAEPATNESQPAASESQPTGEAEPDTDNPRSRGRKSKVLFAALVLGGLVNVCTVNINHYGPAGEPSDTGRASRSTASNATTPRIAVDTPPSVQPQRSQARDVASEDNPEASRPRRAAKPRARRSARKPAEPKPPAVAPRRKGKASSGDGDKWPVIVAPVRRIPNVWEETER